MPSYAKFDVWQNTEGVNYNAILQVQSTQLTTTFSTTTTIASGGAAVTGLSVNITPKYTTSKILVFGHLVTGYTSATTATFYQLKRNGTDVGNGTASGSRPGIIARSYIADNNVNQTDAFSFLDSPASVSLLTYQIYVGTQGAGTVYVNRTANDDNAAYGARGSSSITVMEIAQ
jgi:hypothetical protein